MDIDNCSARTAVVLIIPLPAGDGTEDAEKMIEIKDRLFSRHLRSLAHAVRYF